MAMLRALLLQTAATQGYFCNAFVGSAHALGNIALGQAHQQQSHASTAAAAHVSGEASSSSDGGEKETQQSDQTQGQQQPTEVQQQMSQLSQPILPTHILLKAVIDSEAEPLDSHGLWHKVQREYGKAFTSRIQFKQHLRRIVKQQWVAPKDPARLESSSAAAVAARAAGGSEPPGAVAVTQQKGKGKGKGAQTKERYVFIPTHHGKKIDLYATGSPLQQAARQLADKWTAQRLPQYTQHLAAGRIPVTPDNIHLLGPDKGLALLKQQQEQQQQHIKQWKTRQSTVRRPLFRPL